MRKPKSVAKLKKDADKWWSQYIRMRDSDKHGFAECITCGTKKPWKEMQCGHFVKRSVSMLRFDDENCNAQCMQCNVYKYGEQYAYSQALDLKYGEGTAAKLHTQRFSTHSFTRQELEDIIDEAKANIRIYDGQN